MPNMSLKKNPMPHQPADVRNKNFLEVCTGYTEDMAIREAMRCLKCRKKPCTKGCPVMIKIPDFIAKVAEGDFEAAYQIISEDSSLPAICGRVDWGRDFLLEMQKREVPIDFFSWHIYTNSVPHVIGRAKSVKEAMIESGYGDAESILNEWNYVQGWTGTDFTYSIEQIIGLKGAAFTLSTMALSQKSDLIDMLMYYDARPSAFNGMFDFYTLRKLKGYYPFLWYGMFYDLECEVRSEADPEDIYTLCGVDKDGKTLSVVSYYINDDVAEDKEITLDFGRNGKYEVYYLDNDHDPTVAEIVDKLEFKLPRCASVLIKEI